MYSLLVGTVVLSVFHALIPSHWLPVLAVSRQGGWTVRYTLLVTFFAGFAHVLSTVLLGFILSLAGRTLAVQVEGFTHWMAPALLVFMGGYFIYRHYYHHHFHLTGENFSWGVVTSLIVAMFFSPCLEIEGFFLAAGQYGWRFVVLLATTYALVSIIGMLLWVRLALAGLKKMDWHAWEHNAGLITGITLVLAGVAMLWWH
ncbi:MAG: hypothetical protein IT259_18780 [Saprospiraceae bacterium]|nr:hypothetical protein [Saprospiraceae bacterium]